MEYPHFFFSSTFTAHSTSFSSFPSASSSSPSRTLSVVDRQRLVSVDKRAQGERSEVVVEVTAAESSMDGSNHGNKNYDDNDDDDDHANALAAMLHDR